MLRRLLHLTAQAWFGAAQERLGLNDPAVLHDSGDGKGICA